MNLQRQTLRVSDTFSSSIKGISSFKRGNGRRRKRCPLPVFRDPVVLCTHLSTILRVCSAYHIISYEQRLRSESPAAYGQLDCVHTPISAAEYFRDSPWLNVPQERQGEILIEPLYPRLGLLGGSPASGAPKVSKLAALAAIRKKERLKAQESKSSSEDQSNESSTPVIERESLESHNRQLSTNSRRRYPGADLVPESRSVRTQDADETLQLQKPTERTVPPNSRPRVENGPELQKPIDISAAIPSAFAETLFGTNEGDSRLSPPSVLSSPSFSFWPYRFGAETKAFLGPSPDDVVTKAQNTKGFLEILIVRLNVTNMIKVSSL